LQTTGKYYHQRPVEPFLRSIYARCKVFFLPKV